MQPAGSWDVNHCGVNNKMVKTFFFSQEHNQSTIMEAVHEASHHSEHFDEIRQLIETKHVDLKAELTKGQLLHDKIQDMTTEMDELNTAITSEVSY